MVKFVPNAELHFLTLLKPLIHMTIQQQTLKLHQVEHQDQESSHEAEYASVSNISNEILNSSLQSIGESPFKNMQLHETKYSKKKIQKITNALKQKCYAC
jgi:hypothetical protein